MTSGDSTSQATGTPGARKGSIFPGMWMLSLGAWDVAKLLGVVGHRRTEGTVTAAVAWILACGFLLLGVVFLRMRHRLFAPAEPSAPGAWLGLAVAGLCALPFLAIPYISEQFGRGVTLAVGLGSAVVMTVGSISLALWVGRRAARREKSTPAATSL